MGRDDVLNFSPTCPLLVPPYDVLARGMLNPSLIIRALAIKGSLVNREQLVDEFLRLGEGVNPLIAALGCRILRTLCQTQRQHNTYAASQNSQ